MNYKRNVLARLVMACLSTVPFVYGASAEVGFQQVVTQPERIEVSTAGRAVAMRKYHEVLNYPEGLHIKVNGVGYDTVQEKHHNVTGIYVLDGTKLTVHKGLQVDLSNAHPYDQADEMAHYYMSGIYAGFGRKQIDDPKYDTQVVVHGPTVIHAVGNGVQANKDSYVTLDGPVTIETVPFQQADVYAAIVEEGSIGIGTGWLADTYTATSLGTATVSTTPVTVQVTGNLGVLNKNYGLNPNPGRHGSFIDLHLETADSTWTGGALNEFAESENNPYNSGVVLRLANQGTWHNQWLGAKRHRADHEELLRKTGKGYTFTGSHIQTLIGGDTQDTAGIIFQEDENPIYVDTVKGYIKIVDKRPNTSNKAPLIVVKRNEGELLFLK